MKPVKESHPPVNPDKISSKGTWAQIKKGVGAFFGYNKLPEKYWVIVGSYKDRDEVQRFADKINKEDETLNAWVGLKLPENSYFPVIVGDQTYLSEAKEIKKRLWRLSLSRMHIYLPGSRNDP